MTRFEKPALAWLAQAMPQWVTSDHLTILGFAGMILAGVCYPLARWDSRMLLVGIAGLAVNWFGDSLDGTLARHRNRQRPRYGFYVDHVVDAFGALFLIGGLGLSEYMSRELSMALLIAYFLVSIEMYLATYTIGVFKLSYGMWGPTELRVLLAIGNLRLLVDPRVTLAGHSWLLFDVGAAAAAVVLVFLAALSAIRNTARLYDEERLG